MAFWNKKKDAAKATDDALPNMEQGEDATLSDAMKAQRAQEAGFRAREKAAAATMTAEDEGLPAVNRRKSSSRMVTILGFIFIGCVAAALIAAATKDKTPRVRKANDAGQVANTMPKIELPPPPPPPAPAPPRAVAVTAGTTGQGTGPQPIGVRQTGSTRGQGGQGKAPLEWWERKMAGGIIVEQQAGSGSGNSANGSRDRDGPQPVRVAAGPADSIGAEEAGSDARPSPDSNGNALGSRLQGTTARAVSAGFLPDRRFLITKSTALECAMETALNSGLPGITRCRLTSDVYSDNGQVLLLDKGTILEGEYQSGIRQGQVRLFVLWTRARTPNGVRIALNSPGTDALGRSGLEGWVDNHFLERFGAAILMSIISDTVQMASGRGGGNNNYYGGAADDGSKIVEKILDSTVNIPPTIVKNQGDHIQVMAARDLDFSTVYGLLGRR